MPVFNPDFDDTNARYAEQFLGDESIGESSEYIRAEREDDDGYDPYSDRIVVEPFFEEDPWR